MKKKGLEFVKERKERTAESAKADTADDVPFVDKLIEFHTVCNSLVRKHFPAAPSVGGDAAAMSAIVAAPGTSAAASASAEMPPHPMYLRTMTSAWESIVNPPVSLKSSADPAQILAHYLDTVLRGHKGKTRLQTDQQQEICKSVVGLWDYLNDKVTFAETHASLLMRRLLKTGHGGRFVSDHATEDMLISLLKTKQTAQCVVTRPRAALLSLDAARACTHTLTRFSSAAASPLLPFFFSFSFSSFPGTRKSSRQCSRTSPLGNRSRISSRSRRCGMICAVTRGARRPDPMHSRASSSLEIAGPRSPGRSRASDSSSLPCSTSARALLSNSTRTRRRTET